MSEFVSITLLIFAAFGFAGAGTSYAVARAREMEDGITDVGMRSVGALLLFFGGACVFAASGISGVFAYGGVVAWSSYVFSAQRLGVFRIEDRYIRGHDPRGAHVVQGDSL